VSSPSTFSIVAYDPNEPAWGIAVASKFLAAAGVVAWAQAGAGAVATQAHANTTYGSHGLQLMASGTSSQDALKTLLANDAQRDVRQVGMVDSRGQSTTFTGKSCIDWAGGITGEGYAIQGNILTGPETVQAMEDAFQQNKADDLIWRLYKALLAGDTVGGDKRGKQSAGILVVKAHGGYGGFTDRWVDLRIDDDPNPVVRLGELLELRDLYFGKSAPEDEIELSGLTLERMQKLMKRLGYYQADIHGQYDQDTRQAFETFIGNENFEERIDAEQGKIDRPVFDYLMQHFGEPE
jgi:uncharacterized Ntn-hydrolase superfamily protein